MENKLRNFKIKPQFGKFAACATYKDNKDYFIGTFDTEHEAGEAFIKINSGKAKLREFKYLKVLDENDKKAIMNLFWTTHDNRDETIANKLKISKHVVSKVIKKELEAHMKRVNFRISKGV